MGFLKTVTGAGNGEVISVENDFEKGTKYLYDGVIFKVLKNQDTGEQKMRRIHSQANGEQIVQLKALRNDLLQKKIQIIKD